MVIQSRIQGSSGIVEGNRGIRDLYGVSDARPVAPRGQFIIIIGLTYCHFSDGDLFRRVLNVQIGLLYIKTDSLADGVLICL